MGKIHLFTPEQTAILTEISKVHYLKDNFYFTGGTALSYLYLKHRHSEDLDFFSPNKFDQEIIFDLVSEWSKKHDFTFTAEFKEIVYVFFLTFKNGETLKLDFGYYPHTRVEKGMKYLGLEADSLLDIAINKFITVNQRSNAKDFVDLYFLFKRFTIWDLIYGAEKKFRMKTDLFLLSMDLLKVEDFDTLPKMIKPLTLSKLKSFYRQKAKELARESVE